MVKVGMLITLCCGIFFVLPLTASVVSPKFIVPNLPDLAIKTRHTSGDGFSRPNMLYLKGSRQRTETVIEKPVRAGAINQTVIRQCDEKRVFVLNERDKIYNSSAIKDRSAWLGKARPINSIQLSGAEVIMTIDSVDTGERRQLGRYTARRIRNTLRLDPGPGAATPVSVEATDGWYIDIPGFGCQDQAFRGFTRLSARSGNLQDRLQVKWLGKAPRGYPIEETSLMTEGKNTRANKIELLELSEAPLDASLFEMPAGYRLALQTGNGGADLTKPDSTAGRTQYYWARLNLWVSSLFR
jgi:hypothetical protein